MNVKSSVRSAVSANRKARSASDREAARAAIQRSVLEYCAAAELPDGSRVAAYEPLPSEPGSIELLVELHRAGYQVIVPITLPDRDLDWARWTLTRQTRQPLGVDAVATASLVLVPAFAVDPTGARLGRGGGSYDRALARVPAGVPVAALLFDGEVIDEVPTDAWDRPVSAVVTQAGWQWLGGRLDAGTLDAAPLLAVDEDEC